ncbi:recombinase family protein [Hespellia stercorisuis]|uniref:Site-specific DNA recombinase n=1 Tax=Hespellia stercorisuis DSM 15480 TaxID=1121950 RepID=A0A1M6TJU7_9FIRM|nr:recombinase family protein [Hespellia stercorisuis]SHK57183.1 Site-specific DNA recombinase [Hespellia stercorisuis DSM 15480]
MLSSNIIEKKKIYRTGIYLRLSKEDGDKAESDSISNQRNLIEDYLEDKDDFCIIDEYVDDGYSGSNFERPAFQRMYDDLKSGAINCVVVKDLSRFGRNYIEVGRYLERMFPVMGVRLIAINDNYDGASEWKNSDSIIVPMRNLMNDAYCRDMSVRIKSQLEVKRKRGEFVGNYVPYGYKRNPRKHSQLIIDDEVAENVRLIFSWKMEGMTDKGIAERLNSIGILCPLEYKKKNGVRVSEHFKRNSTAQWSAKMIYRILHNDIYAGNMTQGMHKKIDYRSKEIIEQPEEKWVRVENTHDPIIDKQQFELIQTIEGTDTRRSPEHSTVMLFSGYIECGECGSKLVRRSSSYRGKKYSYYNCSGYKADKHSCTPHNISHDKLYDIVLETVRQQISVTIKMEQFLASVDELPLKRKRVVQLDGQMEKLQEELEKNQRIKKKLFQDYSEGILNRGEYLEYIELYMNKISNCKEKMEEVANQRKDTMSDNIDGPWVTSFKKYRNLQELTRPIVVELIEKIVVHQNNAIEIRFKYQDAMNEIMEQMSMEIQDDSGENQVAACK